MQVIFCYLLALFIWSTTPIAMVWSLEGSNFIFNSFSRFLIALFFLTAILSLQRRTLPMNKPALMTYLLAGIGFYSFIGMYWGAKYVPSGWIAIMYGLAPALTAVISALLYKEKTLTPVKVIGLITGIGGLLVVFMTGAEAGKMVSYGLLAVLVGVVLTSLTAVMIKKNGADVPAMAVTTGGVIVAFPMYLLTWLVFAAPLPEGMSIRATYSLLYFGVFGTGIVFLAYFYLLKKIPVTRAATLGILTPVFGLIIGVMWNNEPLTLRIILGTGLILLSVFIHEFLPARFRQATS